MDLLEDFFARHKIVDNAIEVTEIEDMFAVEEPVTVLVLVVRKGSLKPRKVPRRMIPNRTRIASMTSPQWVEWILVPLTVGQFWWLALLSLPALSAQTQCNNHFSRHLVQNSVELMTESFRL